MFPAEFRLLVFGGRRGNTRERVWREIDRMVVGVPLAQLVIINGRAKGTDEFSSEWAQRHAPLGVREAPFPARWHDLTRPGAVIRRRRDGTSYDLLAGFARNQRMLDEGSPTHALEFPGGNGTADMHARIIDAISRGATITLRVIPEMQKGTPAPLSAKVPFVPTERSR